jgi:tryptophan 6-halogenase
MRIVIAGGGTAGWLAALTLCKTRKDIDVTVIESSKIGIIGAGEGSTGLFTQFIRGDWFDTEIDIKEFVRETNATVKMGIRHVNWTGDETSYFAPLDGSNTAYNIPDIDLCNALIDTPDEFHLASHGGQCHELGADENHSYHFDAFLVGKYFSKIAIRNGVTIIDTEIDKVNVEDDSIKSLDLSNGDSIEADLYIDCTGFKRILMNALGVGWKSYKRHLPVDSAIAFQMPIDPGYERVTTAHALKNGWVWKIPTSKRFGCGYVYSSEFTTQEDAEAEIKEHYGDVKILRKFEFNSGRSEEVWHTNCLSLGLAAAFSEPLEATSIHTTIVQCMSFVYNHLFDTIEDTLQESSIQQYNKVSNEMYDDLMEFLVLHYMGGREDSDFWRYIKEGNIMTPQVKYMLDKSKYAVPTWIDTRAYNGSPGTMLWNWILAGLGYIDGTTASNTLERF